LSDALVWSQGNRYTFRLRPSTYMQAAMLVEEAAKLPARRWAVVAPNYEYGQSAVRWFKELLTKARPDVQFVAEQLVTIRNKRGYARQEWQKMRERNEALDTRIYARAAAWILGADRFDERMWRQLEKQAGIETATIGQTAEPEKPTAPEAGRITAPRRRGWKISTPRYME
jgi:hypothetical protein